MASNSSTALTGVVESGSSIARDLAERFEQLFGAEVIDLTHPDGEAHGAFALVPKGLEVVSIKEYIDEFRDAPERRAGTARVRDNASFIALVNRHKDEDSAIFADPSHSAPKLTAVIDYHEAGPADGSVPRFGEHRVVYECPLSDEWKAWMAKNAQTMAQGDFAAWLEDRIGDVILVDPASDGDLSDLADMLGGRFTGSSGLMQLARGLAVNVETQVREAVTLQSGEISIQYTEVHKDGAGEPIKVPNLFCIAIPVFYGGPTYRIPVRLRYRVQQQRVTWSYVLYRPDRVFDDAFQEICAAAKNGTELSLYVGAPEA